MSTLWSPGVKWTGVVAFNNILTVECFKIYFNLFVSYKVCFLLMKTDKLFLRGKILVASSPHQPGLLLGEQVRGQLDPLLWEYFKSKTFSVPEYDLNKYFKPFISVTESN